jgi:MerE protein
MSTSAETRGVLWVVGALLLCPCHLPLTLWLLGTLLYGTLAGALLHEHPYVAGAVISVVWLAATWHGVRLLRATQECARGAARGRPGRSCGG